MPACAGRSNPLSEEEIDVMFAKLLIASALLTTPVPGPEQVPPSTANLTVAADPSGALQVESRSAGAITVDLLTPSGIIATRYVDGGVVTPGATRTFQTATTEVAEGVYRGRVRLVRVDGAVEEAEATVAIDQTPPRIRLRPLTTAPTTGPVRMRARVEDASATVDASWVIENQSGVEIAEIALRPPAAGRWVTLRWNGRIDGRRVMPGLYLLRLQVGDEAGNEGQSPARRVRVERAVRTRTVFAGARSRDVVALTFDDCASADSWRRILDGLKSANVRGTFFCNGRNVAAYPELARRTVAEGHVIGSHTWDHPIMPRLSGSAQRSQIQRDTAVWWRVARAMPAPYFRAPYGSQDGSTLAAAGAESFAYSVLWDVDPRDWEEPGAAVVADRVVSRSRAGSIAVLHTARSTAGGLAGMIRGLRAKGLEPVALDEMPGLTPGVRE